MSSLPSQKSTISRHLLLGMVMTVVCSGVAWAGTQSAQGCTAAASNRFLFGTFADLLRCLAKPAAPATAPVTVAPGSKKSEVMPKSVAATPPTPEVTPLQAPTLAGLDSIPSGADLSAYLTPSWGTGAIASPEEGGVEGAFRFLCAPSHNAYSDPIVYPGQPGKSHLHTFFGNTKADANSTYASLRTTGDSTCNNVLNRSAYWIAAMIHPSGKVVMPDWLQVYYKRISADNPGCKEIAKACLPLPRGLRYVFGYNMLNPAKSDPADMRWWRCDGQGAPDGGHLSSLKVAATGCPTGARIGAIVVAPNCWNGTDLDSPDHRSHMAFPQQNGSGAAVCPKTHPYLIPQFQLQAWYTNDGTAGQWRLSSDDMAGMPPAEAGSTLHADWFGAWEDSVLATWEANCINKLLSCSGGDLGNGRQLKTLAGYDQAHGRPLVDVPPRLN